MATKIKTTPIPVRKSVRLDEWRGLTSCKAGEIVPVAYFPLLREDRIRASVGVQVRMAEAVHVILNPIRVTVHAHLIPKTALERFNGSLETLNRSYAGELMPDGSAAPPWYVAEAALPQGDTGHEFYDKLGIHYGPIAYPVNNDLLESYWAMVNWRRTETSSGLAKLAISSSLAPAFWDSWRFDHIKPSFDAALMEGSVPVDITGGQTRVVMGNISGGTTGGLPTGTDLKARVSGTAPDQIPFFLDGDGTSGDFSVELGGQGSISLANIELAKQTQRFAKMREAYRGVPDEYLVDLLMRGIAIPASEFKEPILIGKASGVIGQTERFATDGASLDMSVANGVLQLSLSLNTPSVNVGGVVLVTVEIVPEQLYERVRDRFMLYEAGGSASREPDYLADYLDPQKVEVVPNSYADIFHTVPTGIFGYAPLNHEWQRSAARVGGRYKRPLPDAFKEDRTRIWAVEKTDPALSEDFYVCPQPFPHTVFADADADPFELIVIGRASVVGNTVFGAGFEEDSDAFDKVIAEVDQARIESIPPTVLVESEAETVTEGNVE